MNAYMCLYIHAYVQTHASQTKEQPKMASPEEATAECEEGESRKEKEYNCVGICFVLLVHVDPCFTGFAKNTATFPTIHAKVVVLVSATSWLSTTKKKPPQLSLSFSQGKIPLLYILRNMIHLVKGNRLSAVGPGTCLSQLLVICFKYTSGDR